MPPHRFTDDDLSSIMKWVDVYQSDVAHDIKVDAVNEIYHILKKRLPEVTQLHVIDLVETLASVTTAECEVNKNSDVYDDIMAHLAALREVTKRNTSEFPPRPLPEELTSRPLPEDFNLRPLPEEYIPRPRPEEYTPRSRPEEYTPRPRPEEYTPRPRPEEYTPHPRPEEFIPRPLPGEFPGGHSRRYSDYMRKLNSSRGVNRYQDALDDRSRDRGMLYLIPPFTPPPSPGFMSYIPRYGRESGDIGKESKESKETKESKESKESKDSKEIRQELHRWMTPDESRHFAKLEKKLQNRIESQFEHFLEERPSNMETLPVRLKILSSSLPNSVKQEAIQKLSQTMGHDSTKFLDWITNLLRIPFGVQTPMSVTSDSSTHDIRKHLNGVRECMDKQIFGHTRFKEEILAFIASWMVPQGASCTTPAELPSVIGLAGPVGVGKTTMVKHALANAVNRPVYFISLGGSSGAATLIGHQYTYEGSHYGEIAAALITTKCESPIIFFDELDKVSSGDNGRGEEVINVLVHLTDPIQNKTFRDRYFHGVDLDLSRALLVFSYNDSEKIPAVLRDRIHEIVVNDFTRDDKQKIATDYILPALCKNLHIPYEVGEEIFEIKEEAMALLMDRCSCTGMRQIKRMLTQLLRAINVVFLTKQAFGPFSKKDVHFPLVVKEKHIQDLIDTYAENKEEQKNNTNLYL